MRLEATVREKMVININKVNVPESDIIWIHVEQLLQRINQTRDDNHKGIKYIEE